MINILLVISKFPPEYSGPGERIPKLYKWLRARGHDYAFRVLCNSIEHSKGMHYTHDGLPVRRICVYRIFGFLPLRFARALHFQFEFICSLYVLLTSPEYKKTRLLHVAGHSGATAAALVWARMRKIPVIMELVNAHAPHRQSYFFIFKTPKIRDLCVIALNEAMGKRCINEGLEAKKLWCRPNPINTDIFHIADKAEKLRLRNLLTHFTDEQIVLVSVAKMMPRKNQILIPEILKYLPERYVALIAGPMVSDGPLKARDEAYVQDMMEIIRSNNLEKRVMVVTGFVSAHEFIKAGDIYLMPAWDEGFGTPMIEAMACGLPVIGNKAEPAFCDWIKTGENGYLCDISEPAEWAHAVQNLGALDNESKRALSDYIHKSAGQDVINQKYEEIIQSLIQASSQQ